MMSAFPSTSHPRRATGCRGRCPTITAMGVSMALLSLTACGQDSEPSQPPVGPPAVSLHMAALEGDLAAVQQHIAAGTDLDQADAYGGTPLSLAVTFGHADVARALMDAGADLDLADGNGSAPLHIAAFFGRVDIATDLLARGAKRRLRNASGATAYDIVAVPFAFDKATYDEVLAQLAPLGLVLDYQQIEASRPVLANLLRAQPDELAAATYAPVARDDGWSVSSPAVQGLDPTLVAELFVDAPEVEKLLGLLVVAKGQLVAEGYYHGGAIDKKELLQSVTKSVTSALVGIALDRGCLSSVDQPVLSYFPELASGITDARKGAVTVRHLLQMRGGFPWEETDPAFWQGILDGHLVRLIADLPLVADPGTAFNYSNGSSHWLGVITTRACDTDLLSFGQQYLFGPLGIEPGAWLKDADGYYIGMAELHLAARDMARFGLLYSRGGVYGGQQIVPATWVAESLQSHSTDAWIADPPQTYAGRYFQKLGYGYQWWSADIGDKRIKFAWGHGGQLIVLYEPLDIIVVALSEPFYGQHDDVAWRHEQASLNLVGKFIQSL